MSERGECCVCKQAFGLETTVNKCYVCDRETHDVGNCCSIVETPYKKLKLVCNTVGCINEATTKGLLARGKLLSELLVRTETLKWSLDNKDKIYGIRCLSKRASDNEEWTNDRNVFGYKHDKEKRSWTVADHYYNDTRVIRSCWLLMQNDVDVLNDWLEALSNFIDNSNRE